jgi:hypothetical protein
MSQLAASKLPARSLERRTAPLRPFSVRVYWRKRSHDGRALPGRAIETTAVSAPPNEQSTGSSPVIGSPSV